MADNETPEAPAEATTAPSTAPPKISRLRTEDDSWSGLCQCGYSTSGWPKESIATERIKQHRAEHESVLEFPDDPSKWAYMEDLVAFRDRHGLVPGETQATAVFVQFPDGAKEIK